MGIIIGEKTDFLEEHFWICNYREKTKENIIEKFRKGVTTKHLELFLILKNNGESDTLLDIDVR